MCGIPGWCKRSATTKAKTFWRYMGCGLNFGVTADARGFWLVVQVERKPIYCSSYSMKNLATNNAFRHWFGAWWIRKTITPSTWLWFLKYISRKYSSMIQKRRTDSAVTINTVLKTIIPICECVVERRISWCFLGSTTLAFIGYRLLFRNYFTSIYRTVGDVWNLPVIW